MEKEKKEKLVSEMKQRLIELADSLGVSLREFSRSIGKSESYIASLQKDITVGVLNKISIIYPKTNITWLVTGEGNKLITEDTSVDLVNHLKEEIKDLKKINSELTREIGRLEGMLECSKKEHAHLDINADSADARKLSSGK